jgi:hypothetical protein
MNADEVVEKVLPYLKHSDPAEDFAVNECREALKQAILSGVLVPQESKPKRPVSVERIVGVLQEMTTNLAGEAYQRAHQEAISLLADMNGETPNPS